MLEYGDSLTLDEFCAAMDNLLKIITPLDREILIKH